MTVRATLFAFILLIFFLGIACGTVFFQNRSRRMAGQSWEDLLARLIAVDRHSLALIASSHFDGQLDGEETAASVELEPGEIWDLVGGMRGLEALEQNCAVLIELARMVQGTYPEALLVAEQLRLNAREIQWHVVRLRDSNKTAAMIHQAFPHYAENAAITYYRMTCNVLELYKVAGILEYPTLQRAL